MDKPFAYVGSALLLLALGMLLGRATRHCPARPDLRPVIDSLERRAVAAEGSAKVQAAAIDSLRARQHRLEEDRPTAQILQHDAYRSLDRVGVDSLAAILLLPPADAR